MGISFTFGSPWGSQGVLGSVTVRRLQQKPPDSFRKMGSCLTGGFLLQEIPAPRRIEGAAAHAHAGNNFENGMGE
jgi:hypothetical protein